MKRILFFALILNAYFTIAQNNKSVSRFSYQHTITFYGNQAISRVEDLFYDGTSSVFVIYSKDLKTSSSETSIDKPDGGNVSVTISSIDESKDFTLYKNYEKKTMISREFLDNGGKCIVKDSIPVLNWVLSLEKKKIGPYMCQKATTTFRCANYVAWFTTDIPLPIGPWKLSGLPGLIVQLIDERDNVTYKYSLLTAEYPSTKHNYIIAPPKTGEVSYSFSEFSKIQLKEAEKQRIFTSASAEDPSNSGYTNTRPECYGIPKK